MTRQKTTKAKNEKRIPFGNDKRKNGGEKKQTAEPKPCRCLFSREAFSRRDAKSLGGHFFLFAFHAHLFEFTLFGFDGCGDFLLDLGCRFFELG